MAKSSKPRASGLVAASKLDELTPAQRSYLENRLKGMNIKESALNAGYSPTFAHTSARTVLEKHPLVKMAMRAANQQAMKELSLTRQHVLQGLLDAVDLAATSTELTGAWREIGKLIGAYEPERVQIDVNHVTSDQLRDMSVQELAALANMQGVIEGEYTSEDTQAEA